MSELKENVKVILDDGAVYSCYMYFSMVEHRGEFCAKETGRVLTTEGRLLEFPGSRVIMVEVLCSGYKELNEIVNKYLEDSAGYDDDVKEIDYNEVDTTSSISDDTAMFG